MKNRLSYLLAILFLIVSCKKEKSISTIYPLSFYPVYPGSFWKYLENDTDTVVSSTASDYIETGFRMNNGKTAYTYVPYLDNEPIFQYQKMCHLNYANTN